jgi:hypothetical protein
VWGDEVKSDIVLGSRREQAERVTPS